MKIKNNKRIEGFSLIEVILAMAIFALIWSAISTLSLGGISSLEQGGKHTQAEGYVQEGIEAVRSIGDREWNSFVFDQSDVEVSGAEWIFSGEGTEGIFDEFTRIITFEDVCRDSGDEITTCPGSYTDPYTKQITVNVSWPIRTGETNEIESKTIISNWDSLDWIQTDWFGGSGQSTWSNIDEYESDGSNVDVSTSGEVKLAEAGGGSWVLSGGSEASHTSDTDFDGGTFSDAEVVGAGSGASILLTSITGWVRSPDANLTSQKINDVEIISNSDVWSVADNGEFIYYNGTSWSIVQDVGNEGVLGIDSVSSSNVWAVGDSGKIWNYNGTTWSENTDTGKDAWYDVVAISSSNVWAVGKKGNVANYNGSSWSTSVVPSKDDIFAVDAISSSNVWAVGNKGKIWNYNGTSWSLHTDTGNETWLSVFAVSSSDVWAVGSGGAIAHYDGVSWDDTIISPTSSEIRGVYFINSSKGYAVAKGGEILEYNGASWSVIADTGNENWNDVELSSSMFGFVVGDNGEIFEYGSAYSTSGTFESEVIDGGTGTHNWNAVRWTEVLPAGSDITIATRSGDTATPDGTWSGWSGELTDETGSNIDSPNSRYIQYRVTFTRGTDPNETPEFQDVTFIYDAPTAQDLYDISSVSDSNIWAVGKNGTIVYYDGVEWVEQTSPTTEDLEGVDALSANNVWAVASKGEIINYNGTSWSVNTDTGNEDWYDVVAISSSNIWAVGKGGDVANYNGSTWAVSAVPSSDDIFAVDAISSSNVWAVGNKGKIWNYNGTSWSLHTDTGNEEWYGIYINSANDILVVGKDGDLATYDGVSWVVTNVASDDLNGFSLSDTSFGWAVGKGGIIYQYDGTFTNFTSPTTQDIYSVETISQNDAWAVGKGGIILHFYQDAGYVTSGNLTSSAFDMGDSSPVQIVDWDEDISSCPLSCTVRIQIRTAPDAGGSPGTWTDWYGVSGAGSYFENSYGDIISTDLNGNQWVQYKVQLDGDGIGTPILQEVRVNYQ